ncbi:ABC transporter permease [Desulfitobacterium sp.]|uniref:ABC transporter permease n=1 Tax=Desulfitobacterium sp. TaxID=49981 RepID=UPI002B20FF07|nr:ABC transporter permease [Desulfitobacterium sp.]MEA4900033.1 ABC transporter permease [Desulfitobacterium sp.]
MKITEMIGGALEGIRVNKLRSTLTMLGMIIGVMAVIVIVTLGQSLNKQVSQTVEGMGANSFALMPIANDNGQIGKLTLDDCNLLKNSVDSIDFVIPVKYLPYPSSLQTIRKKEPSMLIGTNSDYPKVDQAGFSQGRFFSESENQMARRVAVISQTVADDLFGPGSVAVGRTLRINNISFQVCGVTKPVASFLGSQQSQTFIPINTLLEISDYQEIQKAMVRVKKSDQLKAATVQSVSILEMRHAAKKGYKAQTNEQMMEQFSSILTIITSVFGALAGIALLVGGIGIMNIMLVSVVERTREIGLRMAIGARRSDILIQFLVESATISAIGGGIGTLLGIGIGAIISTVLKMPVVISLGTILFAFCFSSGIGILFGLYPANRAAKLDPIDALRYE